MKDQLFCKAKFTFLESVQVTQAQSTEIMTAVVANAELECILGELARISHQAA